MKIGHKDLVKMFIERNIFLNCSRCHTLELMKVLFLSMYDSVCVKIRFQVMEVTSYILMLLTIFDFVEKFMEENCGSQKD